MDPFNIDILVLTKEKAKLLGQVKSLAIMETGTQNFDQEGLYSSRIFGQVGSEERNNTFGYIDLQVNVLHPLVYEQLTTLKVFYKDIAEAKKYALWDNKIKDFIPSTIAEGKTGISFLLEHAHDIKANDNKSDQRAFKIKMIKKYTDNTMLLSRWLVLPAGLRDYTIDKNGKPTEDEVNDLYRRLLGTVNMLSNIKVKTTDLETINPIILKIQNGILAIYKHYETLLKGKHKFIEGKWAKRAISYGTRNVITSATVTPVTLHDATQFSFNDTIIGLYQFIAGISPIAKNKIISTFIGRIFNPSSDMANLVDMKTMKTVYTTIDTVKRDEWLTDEGLDGVISKFAQEVNRSEPIIVDGKYLMLIYDHNKIIEPIFNTDTMRDEINPKYLRPITYAELIYLSIYDIRNKYPALVTRYPVANIGGIYPTNLYVKTTVNGRNIKLILNGIEKDIIEYPILTEKYFNSTAVHASKLKAMGGDYDGDTISLNILLEDDVIEEINTLFKSREFYILPNGRIAHSVATDPLELVLKSMTL